MKKTLFMLIAACSCAIVLTECKKKEDPEPELSKTEMLAGTSSRTYKMTAETENGVSRLMMPNYADCNLDDLYKFYTDYKYVHLEGALKCGTDDTVCHGTWRFNGGQDSLIIDTNNGQDAETVKVNISKSSFQKDHSGPGSVFITTYTAQ
jgi:hypothetical protein